MPLRVLLLLPDGVEQPSTSSTSKLPKSPSSPSFTSPLKLGIPSRPSSRLSNNAHERHDHSSKPLPSPPPIAVSSARSSSSISNPNGKANTAGGINRASHLTIPSTSGSSAGSSTEYVPSPPLSPSPTTTTQRDNEGGYAYDAETTVRGLRLNKNKHKGKEGLKPVLSINTKLPKTGRGVRYLSSQWRGSADYTGEYPTADEEEEEGEEVLEVSQGSTSRTNDDGAATARRAVDDRLQHLLATTELSPADAHVPSLITRSSVLQRISQMSSGGRPIISQVQSSVSPAQPSTSHSRSSRHQRRRKSHNGKQRHPRNHPSNHTDPPPPPTRSLAPYRIFGTQDVVPLDVVSDPWRAGRVDIKAGWSRTGVVIHSTRHSRPKGTKGKYIRLLTLPPLPPSKLARVADVEEESLHEGVVLRRRGIMPTVLVEDNGYGDDEEHVNEDREKEKEKVVPTVFMTELVAAQFDRPIPCMMYPPPPPALTSSSTTSSRRGSFLTSRPLSTISALSRQHQQLHPFQPTSKTYQLPLPLLTPLQKTSLHTAGLLVYAVPPSYTGAIPPPECVKIGEEIVPPWVQAEGRLPLLQTQTGSGVEGRGRTAAWVEGASASSAGSPRGSGFGVMSPVHGKSPLGLNAPLGPLESQSGAGAGGVLSGSLSPRWPVEGLWSRAKGYQRNSNASGMTVESPVPSRPNSGIASPGDEKAAASEDLQGNSGPTATGGWSSSFSSIRARAQGYYAKDGSATSMPSPSSPDVTLPSSKSEIITTGSGGDLASAPMSRGTTTLATSSASSTPITASRSFGSLFLRTAPSTTSNTGSGSGNPTPSTSSPSSAGLSAPGSTLASSAPIGKGEVLFEFVEPPRDGEVVKVEIIETGVMEPVPANTTAAGGGKGWRGWGARWGA